MTRLLHPHVSGMEVTVDAARADAWRAAGWLDPEPLPSPEPPSSEDSSTPSHPDSELDPSADDLSPEED